MGPQVSSSSSEVILGTVTVFRMAGFSTVRASAAVATAVSSVPCNPINLLVLINDKEVIYYLGLGFRV